MSKRNRRHQDTSDKVMLEPNKYPSLQANLDAKGVKLKVQAKTIDTRNSIIQDLTKSYTGFQNLVNKNDPTQIPYLTTTQGNMLVNPSTVSISTLQKVAQNEIVAKCLDMNAVSIVNSIGNVRHDDKKIQDFLRENYRDCEGGLRRIVENILTADVSGFSLNYGRYYVDDYGYLRLQQLDLLPPSTVLFSATPRGDIDNIYMYVYSYPYANTQNLFSFPFFAGDTSQCGAGIDSLASYGNFDSVLRTNILNTSGLIKLDKSNCIHNVADNVIKTANPYGWNPLTKRVYDLVMLYDLYKELHSTFLSYKACPLLVGYAKANATVDDPTGNGATMSALDGLYNSMKTMGFNGALMLSGLKDEIYHIEAIQSQGDTTAFQTALDWYKREIEQCMGLFSTDESSYASATTQTGFYGRLTSNKKDKIVDIIKHTINKKLIHANFSKDIKDFGRFENEVQNIDDQMKLTKIFREQVATTGFNPGILKKDNDFMRIQLKQPLLTDAEFKELKDAAFEAEHPMDNSNGINTRESRSHYSHGSNSDV